MAFYQWFPDPFFSPAISATEAGSYIVMTTDAYGCNAISDTVEIILLDAPAPPVITSNNPICSGDSLFISSTFDSTSIFHWTFPNGNQLTDPNVLIFPAMLNNSGIYTASLSNGICLTTDSILIVVDSLKYNGIITSGTGCIGEYFQIQTIPDSLPNYQWTSSNGLNYSGFEIQFNLLQQSDSGLYFLNAVSGACMIRDSVSIYPQSCENEITNVFTPNGDGLNDEYIFNELNSNESATVINRWGQKVFETENNKHNWNGNFMNSDQSCPEGAYYFIIKYSDKGNSANKRGIIQLLR